MHISKGEFEETKEGRGETNDREPLGAGPFPTLASSPPSKGQPHLYVFYMLGYILEKVP